MSKQMAVLSTTEREDNLNLAMTHDRGSKTCRFCASPLTVNLVDLGMSPLCESYLAADQINVMEPFYPLHVFVCSQCYLAQLGEYVRAEHIFSEYAYFSSYSDSWLKHSKKYADLMTQRLGLGSKSLMIELASNDGYLLQYFVEKDIPVLGIEPAANVAKVAVEKGVPTLVEFFGVELARKLATSGQRPDLLLGNNVLAQVPDLNDFVEGMKILLSRGGVITMEFPHLLRLMDENQFDTIYHEHFSYFSSPHRGQDLRGARLDLVRRRGAPSHGGSLRIYARHANDQTKPVSAARVGALAARTSRRPEPDGTILRV